MNLLEITKKYKDVLTNLYQSGFKHSALNDYEKGSIRIFESYVIYSLMREFKCQNILDIGTGKSFSSLIMAKALKDENLDGIVHSIDINQNFSYDVFERFELTKYFQFHQGKSDDTIPKFEQNYFDLALIDGLHTYEQTKRDLINIFPRVKTNGFILFHDVYIRTQPKSGPRDVLEELKEEEVGEVIYFPQEIFDFFSFSEDIEDYNRMSNKWREHNYSYASPLANAKELMALFVKKKDNLNLKSEKEEIQKDEPFLEEWLNG